MLSRVKPDICISAHLMHTCTCCAKCSKCNSMHTCVGLFSHFRRCPGPDPFPLISLLHLTSSIYSHLASEQSRFADGRCLTQSGDDRVLGRRGHGHREGGGHRGGHPGQLPQETRQADAGAGHPGPRQGGKSLSQYINYKYVLLPSCQALSSNP